MFVEKVLLPDVTGSFSELTLENKAIRLALDVSPYGIDEFD